MFVIFKATILKTKINRIELKRFCLNSRSAAYTPVGSSSHDDLNMFLDGGI